MHLVFDYEIYLLINVPIQMQFIENTSWKVLATVFTHELLTYQKSNEWVQRTSKISDTKTTSA